MVEEVLTVHKMYNIRTVKIAGALKTMTKSPLKRVAPAIVKRTVAAPGRKPNAANSHWEAGTAIEVAAADLADVWSEGETPAGGSDTMYVRAFDGTSWSNWDNFTLTSLPNNLPITTINNQTLHINEWNEVGDLLSYSDADGHPAARYQFWDGGSAANSGYFWTPRIPTGRPLRQSKLALPTSMMSGFVVASPPARKRCTCGASMGSTGVRGVHLNSRPSSSNPTVFQ